MQLICIEQLFPAERPYVSSSWFTKSPNVNSNPTKSPVYVGSIKHVFDFTQIEILWLTECFKILDKTNHQKCNRFVRICHGSAFTSQSGCQERIPLFAIGLGVERWLLHGQLLLEFAFTSISTFITIQIVQIVNAKIPQQRECQRERIHRKFVSCANEWVFWTWAFGPNEIVGVLLVRICYWFTHLDYSSQYGWKDWKIEWAWELPVRQMSKPSDHRCVPWVVSSQGELLSVRKKDVTLLECSERGCLILPREKE